MSSILSQIVASTHIQLQYHILQELGRTTYIHHFGKRHWSNLHEGVTNHWQQLCWLRIELRTLSSTKLLEICSEMKHLSSEQQSSILADKVEALKFFNWEMIMQELEFKLLTLMRLLKGGKTIFFKLRKNILYSLIHVLATFRVLWILLLHVKDVHFVSACYSLSSHIIRH